MTGKALKLQAETVGAAERAKAPSPGLNDRQGIETSSPLPWKNKFKNPRPGTE
jgi:hypothetical protein